MSECVFEQARQACGDVAVVAVSHTLRPSADHRRNPAAHPGAEVAPGPDTSQHDLEVFQRKALSRRIPCQIGRPPNDYLHS